MREGLLNIGDVNKDKNSHIAIAMITLPDKINQSYVNPIATQWPHHNTSLVKYNQR